MSCWPFQNGIVNKFIYFSTQEFGSSVLRLLVRECKTTTSGLALEVSITFAVSSKE